MDVGLVALDIDGTIVPADHPEHAVPPPRIRRAVAALVEREIFVVLASGRMFPGTADVARRLGLTTPVISQQGCATNMLDGTVVHRFTLDDGAARAIAGHARERGLAYEWITEHRYVVSEETVATNEYARLSGVPAEWHPMPEDCGEAATGVGVLSAPPVTEEVHRYIVSEFGESLHVLDFPDVTVAVAADANKGHALSLLCAEYGIDRGRVVAIGDSVNDAPMLAWAGHGYATAGADRYARDAADHVLDGGIDAVAALLEEIAGISPMAGEPTPGGDQDTRSYSSL